MPGPIRLGLANGPHTPSTLADERAVLWAVGEGLPHSTRRRIEAEHGRKAAGILQPCASSP
jgi:hypothetical protein